MEMASRRTTPGGGRTAARRVACVRCRRRKKRCDHVVPVCGECKRTGAECVQLGRRSSGAFTTVPTAYIRQLEGIAGRDDQDQAIHVTLDIAEHSRSPEDDHFDGSCGRDVTENSDQSSPHEVQNHLNDLVCSTAGQSSHLNTSSPQTRDSSVPESVPSVAELGQDPRNVQGRANYLPEIEPLRSQDITISSTERLVLRPLSDIVIFIGEDWMDHYANIYFQHIQPQWSFLDEYAWRKAYETWKRNPYKVESVESFIIQLALAVGALACSSFRMDCQHSAHATKLHDGAVRNHFIHTTQHPLALIRTQTSLLSLLYAFHSPSPAGIPGGIMLVLMNCASLVEEHDEAGNPQCLNAN
ncbi:hypothetical protein LZ31DRAFT_600974 [Colletotrichum somersetense]|nr:hypothetical protein LZ31DRAFT_600974 [Colletotrichum somersetense]